MSASKRFVELSRFVSKGMRMSHIYQPVMLMELLRRGGRASADEIAKAILLHDPSQIDYYKQITHNMVGRVLTKNRGITSRDKDVYSLNGFPELSPEEANRLIEQCESKLEQYLEKRGDLVWQHRTKPGEYVSGTKRYEVLKRAKFRCELCGVSAEEKALEVDHIEPRNWGGEDDLSNLQALCYTCNASKRDRDNTDFRKIAELYKAKQPGCLFCQNDEKAVVAENRLVYAIRDGFPVTKLHTLLIPKRHVESYLDLFQPEINAVHSLLKEVQAAIIKEDAAVSGFNTGTNNGVDAGQTVLHCHLHLIPRRKGDIEDPRGGVRGVIADRRIY
jgi:ATP adenylyltransferase